MASRMDRACVGADDLVEAEIEGVVDEEGVVCSIRTLEGGEDGVVEGDVEGDEMEGEDGGLVRWKRGGDGRGVGVVAVQDVGELGALQGGDHCGAAVRLAGEVVGGDVAAGGGLSDGLGVQRAEAGGRGGEEGEVARVGGEEEVVLARGRKAEGGQGANLGEERRAMERLQQKGLWVQTVEMQGRGGG